MTARVSLAWLLGVTLLFSWGLLALFLATGGVPGTTAFYSNVVLAYGLGPLAGALALQWRRREPAYALLGGDPFPNRWFLVAWVIPPAIAVGSMLLSNFSPGAELAFDPLRKLETVAGQLPPEQLAEARKNLAGVSPWLFFFGNLMPALLYGATLNAAVAMAEEVGWRVMLLRELKGLGFFGAALTTGLVRGLWAFPLAWYGFPLRESPHQGAWVVLATSLVVGLLSSYLRLRSGSVLPAALLWGGLSSGGEDLVSRLFVVGGVDWQTGLTGLPGLVLLTVVTLLVVLPGWRQADEALRGLGSAVPDRSR
jgi:hypothetical protein